MSDLLFFSISALSVIGILAGIYLMSKVSTAVKGNLIGSFCTALAVIAVLVKYDLLSDMILWIFMAAGLVLGYIWAYKVKMIQMPQLVALFNGFGGAASAIIAWHTLSNNQDIAIFESITASLALAIGVITLIGSLIAAGKLHNLINSKPLILKNHMLYTSASLVIVVLLVILIVIYPTSYTLLILSVAFSTLFSILFTIRIGGADMPITISLLNSLSGVAGAIAGMAVNSILLTAVGGIVGASGLLLTQIMCKSMNRSLLDILLGKTTTTTSSTESSIISTEHKDDNLDKTDIFEVMREAKNVIIVPGYGMALAQAQFLVKQLADKFEMMGATVRFAIHPVAGRMPGHMNVLLSEADIAYDQLYEMDDINPEFEHCDLAIVIGANDVVNPAAKTTEDTPIYGMPILDVSNAAHILICNYDLKPGYAGVDNPLYKQHSNVTLMLGDAKDSLENILSSL